MVPTGWPRKTTNDLLKASQASATAGCVSNPYCDLGVLNPDLLPGEYKPSRWSINLKLLSALDEGRGESKGTPNNSFRDLSSHDLCLSIFKGLGGLSKILEKSKSSISAKAWWASTLFELPFWDMSPSRLDICRMFCQRQNTQLWA